MEALECIKTRRSIRKFTEQPVTEDEVRKVVADKGHYAESMPVSEYPAKFISGWLIKYWPQIVEIIDNGRSARD